MKIKSVLAKSVAAVSAFVLSVSVSAESILPTTMSSDMADTKSDILIVGGAVLGLTLAIVSFRWVRKAF